MLNRTAVRPEQLATYRQLVATIHYANQRTPEQIADRIRAAGIVGERGSVDASPVGLWLVDELHTAGIPAETYSWVGDDFTVYDREGRVLARIRIPSGPTAGTLHELECLVNDLDHDFADLVEGEPLGEADRAELAAIEPLE
ncbi:hypothetical protein CDO52_12900 [Nocardiopsis gilva YIM 90087]|uniref:Uncharacterized protein n=1 Tax=Nocardiopsis gilva YIM 90087 TaxID=1235441 RepID=A0A223S5Z5_9ACTN|nr:hypothetical protein [Nocardiopsis gilva]ASU83567.1 hypothetical protein CDO52_12900 [Nocardiopsis gilva YIM 90087]